MSIAATGQDLNWCARGLERDLQNISNLLSLQKYDAAFAREMGIDSSVLDRAGEDAILDIKDEIYSNMDDYYPDVETGDIDIKLSGRGNLTATLEVGDELDDE